MTNFNQFIAKAILSILLFLDHKLGYVKSYEYETAPYCGHHYSGHDGKFTEARYHEGDGGVSHTNALFTVIEIDGVHSMHLSFKIPNIKTIITDFKDRRRLNALIVETKTKLKAKDDEMSLLVAEARDRKITGDDVVIYLTKYDGIKDEQDSLKTCVEGLHKALKQLR